MFIYIYIYRFIYLFILYTYLYKIDLYLHQIQRHIVFNNKQFTYANIYRRQITTSRPPIFETICSMWYPNIINEYK